LPEALHVVLCQGERIAAQDKKGSGEEVGFHGLKDWLANLQRNN